jgi:hypothetical protein
MARARSKNSLILKLKMSAAAAGVFARLIKFGELLTRSLLRLSTLAANFHHTIFVDFSKRMRVTRRLRI